MFEFYLKILLANWKRALVGGVIVVSAIIVLMGILKTGVINKIKNKLVRKVVLAFGSIALVLPCTALYFVGDGINFDHYWLGCAMNAVAVILTYWLYENTALRNLIHKIGSVTLGKFVKYIANRIVSNGTSADDKKALQDLTDSLGSEVRNELGGALGAKDNSATISALKKELKEIDNL